MQPSAILGTSALEVVMPWAPYPWFMQHLLYACVFLLLSGTSLVGQPLGSGILRSLYHSIDPQHASELAAFAELFPSTSEGQDARARVWQLLSGAPNDAPPPSAWPADIVQLLVNRFVSPKAPPPPDLPAEFALLLDVGVRRLQHVECAGHHVWSEEEMLALPEDQIDLARGLLLQQDLPRNAILAYERALDLMALQVLARVPPEGSDLDKLAALSHFIFVEQRFRFPPKSRMNLEIDEWTMLSQVLDSRRGVCLGVSQLYLSLAQRIGLPLEIITPPGHIFVRWNGDGAEWNIETTAHGMPLPTSQYLGLTCRALTPRTLREVLGMNLFNAAGRPLTAGEPEKALALYERAEKYLGAEEYNLAQAKGMALVCLGRLEEARTVLAPLRTDTPPEHVVPSGLILDVLDREASGEVLRLVLAELPNHRSGLQERIQELDEALARCPQFLSGYQHLAICHLQLGRTAAALEVAQTAYERGSRDPFLLYLLTELSLQRYQGRAAVRYCQDLRSVLAAAKHEPQILLNLEQGLRAAGWLHETSTAQP